MLYPVRYSEFLKATNSVKFIMPTWTFQELLRVNKQIDLWYEWFVLLGGVPRSVFRDILSPEKNLLSMYG